METVRKTDGPELPEDEIKGLWDRIVKINKGRPRRRFSLVAAAASVAAAIALLLLLDIGGRGDKGVDYQAMMESARILRERSDNIQLVLSAQERYLLEGKESEIEYDNANVRINSGTIAPLNSDGVRELPYNTLVVPAGKRARLALADGTKLWVNSESTVIYPTRFDGGNREIFVEGEAYLDVFRQELLPFVVKTGRVDVRVLGTRFNVLSHGDESFTEVVLVSGRVEVTAGGGDSAILAPDDLYRYDAATGESSVTKTDVTDHVAWKDGYYPFNSQPMDMILRKIARYYGMEIIWDDNVSALTCSGKLDLKDDPAEVFSLLAEAAPIVIHQKNGKYLVKVKP
jgi:ferric-dicitrate binding protein FerR (iron transport regulator)